MGMARELQFSDVLRETHKLPRNLYRKRFDSARQQWVALEKSLSDGHHSLHGDRLACWRALSFIWSVSSGKEIAASSELVSLFRLRGTEVVVVHRATPRRRP